MKFIDEALVSVIAGNGGNGSAHFRREKFIPRGGPDGGDGGAGGSVYLQADSGLNTLVDFRYQPTLEAQHGEHGGAAQCTGKSGTDKVARVPLGTKVSHRATGQLIGDLCFHGQRLLVARGGRGGIGNVHFKSSTNRSPQKTIPGEAGERCDLVLELQLLADVALLGAPNAGKSSLVSILSAARPKIGAYPFTTLTPSLGVVSVGSHQSFVMADIPGLIEGAAQGVGLGVVFLKHLTRASLLLCVVDCAPLEGEDSVIETVLILRRELREYAQERHNTLDQKPCVLVLNKIDMIAESERAEYIQDLSKRVYEACAAEGFSWYGAQSFGISAATGFGTEALAHYCMQSLGQIPRPFFDQRVEGEVSSTPDREEEQRLSYGKARGGAPEAETWSACDHLSDDPIFDVDQAL